MPSAKQDARKHEAALVRNERKLEREIIAFFSLLFLAMKESFKETGLPGARSEIQRAQPALQEILQNSYMRSGPDGIKLTAEQLEEDNSSEEAALLALLVWAQAESQVASTQIINTTSSIMDDLIADQIAVDQAAGVDLQPEKILRELKKRNRNRAGTIGTTEAANGISRGQHEGAEEIQRGQIFTVKKHWASKRDFKVRGTHARADRRYRRAPIGINELFQVGSGFGLHPLASTLPIGERVHCRCFSRYIKVKV
jgi:hypothetical protein